MNVHRLLGDARDCLQQAGRVVAGPRPRHEEALREIVRARALLDSAEYGIVLAARTPGPGEDQVSWDAIGRALGMSRQAASKRFTGR